MVRHKNGIPVEPLGDLASRGTMVLVGQGIDVGSEGSRRGGIDTSDMMVKANLQGLLSASVADVQSCSSGDLRVWKQPAPAA